MNSEKPVALFVGYGVDHTKDKPDVRGRLQVLAANEMVRREEVSRVVFTTGADWGKPAVAYPMVAQIFRNSPRFPTEKVGVYPEGRNITSREIKQFRKVASENDYNNLLVVGNDTHLERIRLLIQQQFGKQTGTHVGVVNTEEYLIGLPNGSWYEHPIAALHASEDEAAFKKRERITKRLESIPFIGNYILEGLAQIGPARYKIGTLVGHLTENISLK